MDYRDDWSPRSATSASSSSPSTPPLRYSDSYAEIDAEIDDNYSPVYSDKECDNNEGTSSFFISTIDMIDYNFFLLYVIWRNQNLRQNIFKSFV